MHIDFTKGDEGRQITKFTYPIILGNLCMQLYNYADSVIVGRYLGKEALAAVGASSPFILMLISLVIGISIGSTVIISQFFGSKSYDNIKKAADSLYISLFFMAIICTFACILLCDSLMELIDLPIELRPIAKQYLDIYLCGLIFLFGFNSLSAILRGVGDSMTPLIFLIVSSVINISLDLLFVITFNWGIEGVAWATVISQGISVIFAILYTNHRSKIIKMNLLDMKFDKKIFLKGIKLGLPAGVQQMLVSFGLIALLSIVNKFGTDTIAAYSAAGRIEHFIMVIPMSLSISLTSFTGQNYSIQNFERIRKGLTYVVKITLISAFLLLVLLSALSEPLMKMFTNEAKVIEVGCEYLYVFGVSYWLFALMFCYMGTLRGMGNTMFPMVITLISLWLFRVPAAILLSKIWGTIGIWLSSTISWAIGAIATYIFLYSRTFKKIYQRERDL